MSSYISLSGVCKSYGQHKVLDMVSVSFEQGKIHGIIGRNGSGKTQLFKVICGYVIPDMGEVIVQNRKIGKEADYPESLGLLIENPGFLPGYSGFFNLQMLAAMNTKLHKKDLYRCLELVGLKNATNKKVGKYSLGMKQRLGIAQAILGDPDLLILDEPFNGLDKTGVNEIRNLLKSFVDNGRTILLASHNPYDISLLCETVHEMDAGKITECTKSLFHN
jgi:ABC-2 type transport system ATP-binding protein